MVLLETCERVLQASFLRESLLDLSQLAATSSHNYNSKIECTDFDSPNLFNIHLVPQYLHIFSLKQWFQNYSVSKG